MPVLKKGYISPTDEEDAAITAAALSDPDALPATDADLAKMRPAHEWASPAMRAAMADKSAPVTIHLVSDAQDAARQAAQRRPRGRPRLDSPKEQINIRLSADVLASLRALGKGWQTRVDQILREAVESGKLV